MNLKDDGKDNPKEKAAIKRKIKLIDRAFQFRLMVRFILVNTVVLLLFGVMIYVFFNSEISTNLASAHAVYRNVSGMLMPIVAALSILNILITGLVIAALVLYSSHKIAGPLYRFNEIINAIAKGNLLPLTRIRENDQLAPLAGSISRMTSLLAQDLGEIQSITAELKTQAEADEPLEHKNLLEKILRLEAITSKYRTGSDNVPLKE